MEHATSQVAEAIRAAEPMRGEPVEALERMVLATWRQLSQFHNLLTINTARLSPQELYRRHLPMTSQFAPLIERGQKAGVFRMDFPVVWHMAVVRSLVHTASHESAGRAHIGSPTVEKTMLSDDQGCPRCFHDPADQASGEVNMNRLRRIWRYIVDRPLA